MRDRIGVGIVGASADRGWARAAHLPALTALADFSIRAVSTTRTDTAERSRQLFGAARAFDNHHELISRPDVDLVVVCVNVTGHREIVSAALEAGKMV